MTHNFKIGDVYKSFDFGSAEHRGWLVVTNVTPSRKQRGSTAFDNIHYSFYSLKKNVVTHTSRDSYILNSSLKESRLIRIKNLVEKAKVVLLTG